jgi:hypothetical protein
MRDYFRNRQVLGSIRQLDVVVPSFFPKTGLVAYYKMDGNSNDSVGSANGTDSDISYVAAKFGQGASFNGSNSEIGLTNSTVRSTFSGTNNYTFSTWIKTSSDKAIIIQGTSNRRSSWHYNAIKVEIYEGGYLNIGRGSGSGWTENIAVSGTLSNGNWNHVVVTYDGSNMIGYVNETQVVSVSSSFSATNPTDWFGLGVYKSENFVVKRFNGLIDEVGIWSRALTSDEITQLYNNGNGLTY